MIYKLKPVDSINEILAKCVPGDTIYLSSGIYYEKVLVLKDNITIVGENPENTIISNHDYYHKIMSDYNECNTFRTFSCYVGGNNVIFEGITIQNTSTPAQKYGQAVALHVHGNNFICKQCILKSEQDTLFTGPLPDDLIIRHQGFLDNHFLSNAHSKQKYINCKIYGNIDFIFGCATALFEKCDIITVNREENDNAYICAPSHDQNTKYGYLFYQCNILSENCKTKIYYGRPWRDYGAAAFIDCNVKCDIHPEGFNKWDGTNRDKTARFYEYEKNNPLNSRVAWINKLTSDEAEKYVNDFYNYMN